MINTENITINLHSSIRINGSKICYFDPFGIEDEINDADIVFITHNHFDHLDPKSVELISNNNTFMVAPACIRNQILDESGIDESHCIFMKAGQVLSVNGVEVTAIAAYNVGKPFHTKESEFLGYVINMDGVKYYVAGDTDENEDNSSVKCDVALIPIGGNYTMDYKQAAQFAADIKPQVVIPTHYGSVVGDAADGEKFAKIIEQMNIGVEAIIKVH